MEHDRLNSPDTSVITFEMMGHQLQFAQDPNSKHLGTTVWDASMVLVKYLEKNSRRGRFCPSKLKGKRVIELGAGCGVAGFGMALLGCDVIATDQIEVLPLLSRNVERNTSRILQMNPDSFGSIRAAELDWGNEDHIRALGPPFDYIIGTDVVYAEHLLEPLLQTISALSGPKTSILLGYEIRSTSVHEQMLDMWRRNFDVKLVPKAKMHTEYQHPSIQLYIMGAKSVMTSSSLINQKAEEESIQNGSGEDKTNCKVDKQVEVGTTKSGLDYNCESKSCVDVVNDIVGESFKEDCQLAMKHKDSKLSDWEARRYGSMAARLLRDVQIK